MVDPTPTSNAAIVETFLTALAAPDVALATSLLSPDVEWRNTGLPTFRGAKVHQMLRDMERRNIVFGVELTHTVENGPVVMTQRFDLLSWKRIKTRFWVCGTFEVHDGLITLWDDHYSNTNIITGMIKLTFGRRA